MNRKTALVSIMMIFALSAGAYGWVSANTANKNISEQKQKLSTMASKNESLETQLEALKISNQVNHASSNSDSASEKADTTSSQSDNLTDITQKITAMMNGLLQGMYSPKTATTMGQYEAMKPYLTGEAIQTFMPDRDTPISANGFQETTINDLRVYVTPQGDDYLLMARYELGNNKTNTNKKTTMVFQGTVRKVSNDYKLAAFDSNRALSGVTP
ncbi:hypothetical protein LacP0245_15420 (plasmid) [Lacticaseibacillus paracasei subsp. tolerans]|uniref:Extracellular protein n=1 Tax=Lacticaseibacillus paracasei TaxID=1597 RepID=A0ABD5D1E1_LACPA|nr:hypothetical protein [Lacticaseibacillus paracasei]MDR7625985.1 hypothetical protein [Lacticaseibacillus paracasei]QPC14920.1 hypothetical protein LacP0245_15420 [Lacticaseibacillus paracasei subsp. tolerans]